LSGVIHKKFDIYQQLIFQKALEFFVLRVLSPQTPDILYLPQKQLGSECHEATEKLSVKSYIEHLSLRKNLI